MKNKIWKYFTYSNNEIKIHLSENFAKEMLETKISEEEQYNLNRTVSKKLENMGISCETPYQFYEDSCLVKEIKINKNPLSTSKNTINTLTKKEHAFPNVIGYYFTEPQKEENKDLLINLFEEWINFSSDIKKNTYENFQ